MPDTPRTGCYRRQQDVIDLVVGLLGFVDLEWPDLGFGIILAAQREIDIGGTIGIGLVAQQITVYRKIEPMIFGNDVVGIR